ncbi:unnamed protein product [Thlaspi arvense]|uniref:Jacalin-type lectin domain-containing protein n=1 Tax=Thlaspi arvense TaxID=13288 RepID=A0AAU9SHX2_THLAR|nr:unnamed protein product [Thlaspi arvense]
MIATILLNPVFEINHLNKEHLVSIKGCYDNTSGVIQGLQLETNLMSSEVMGYDENGTKFTLEAGGNKIIGFHGSAETNLMSLGAYFTTLPPVKLELQGGCGGHSWDQGVYTGVTYSPSGISHIIVDYDKAGQVETRQNGDRLGENRVQGEQKEPSNLVRSLNLLHHLPRRNRRASWDDGVFNGVRKIYVGQGENGVASVKFVYDKNNQVELGEDHGKMTMLGYEEFELAYPSEYITAVEVCNDKIFGSDSTVITISTFWTRIYLKLHT